MSISSSTEAELTSTSLCIWPPYRTLPSVDPECLCALAHMSFSRLNVPINTNLGRFRYFNEHFPLLVGSNEKVPLVAGFQAIVDYCRQSHINIDNRTAADAADLLALSAYVKSNLVPAVLDTFWLDETYRRSVINIYARALGGFPLAFFYGKRTSENLKRQLILTNKDEDIDRIRKTIFERGKKVLDHLSEVLGGSSFIFGATPTSVDALVFGYLACLIHGPASNSALARHASTRQNLREFVDRILTVYLGDLPRDNTPIESSVTTTSSSSTEDRFRDKVAVVGIGILIMCGYAYMSGLIRVEIDPIE